MKKATEFQMVEGFHIVGGEMRIQQLMPDTEGWTRGLGKSSIPQDQSVCMDSANAGEPAVPPAPPPFKT
jgi:hypothetical protein